MEDQPEGEEEEVDDEGEEATLQAEGDVDFDDGLLPEEEEEDVEMLSDDKVFQALNEDLNAM